MSVPEKSSLSLILKCLSPFFFKMYLFILWLWWVFVAAQAFSSCGEQVLLSGWDNRLPLAVFSLAGRDRLWGSVAAAHGLGVNSCGSRTLEHRLGSCGMLAQLLCSIWDLPGSGIEPVSPALAGRFFTTKPPGKPCLCFILLKKKIFFWLPGSSLLCTGYLQRRWVGAAVELWCAGFSLRSTGSGAWSQWLWHIGLVPPWPVEPPQTRDRACVPCIGRQILNHWTTREVQLPVFYYTHFNNEKIEPHDINLCMITLPLSGRNGMWWALSQATITTYQRQDDLDHIYFPHFWRLEVQDLISGVGSVPGRQTSALSVSSGGGESGRHSCLRGH